MEVSELGKFTPDVHKFKVICQRCGKTGEVDFDKAWKEAGYVLFVNKYGKYEYEYWLCWDCCMKLR